VLFTAALLLSSVLTHYVRNAALKYGLTCNSIRRRDIHASPIPRLGGLAICLTFMTVALGYVAIYRLCGIGTGFGIYTTFAVLAPATLMFILGLVDDARSIGPQVKFGVQIIAGLLLYYGGIRIYFFPIIAGYHELNGVISLILTVLWVLLISNAFNLIDGLDGLSAGSALFSTLVVFVVSLFSGNPFVAVMSVTLAGAILGFLRYNFNPATIFLGDCGSLFLGFMLSAVSLAGMQKSTTLVAVAIPIVSFGLPLLDTVLSVVRRFLSGQPLFTADREHIHHKLLKRGFTHKQAVVMLYGVSAALGLTSLLLLYPPGRATGIVMTVVGVFILFGVQHLGYHEFAELGRAAKRTMDQKQIIVNNLSVRRGTEELASADDFSDVCNILEATFGCNEFDGFDLAFRPAFREHALIPAPFVRNYDGSYRLEWRKPAAQPVASRWQLSLVLNGASLGSDATFTVYRGHNSRHLLFDINLLTGEFQTVLSDALQRALEAPQEVVMLAGIPSVGPAMESAVATPQQ
jgi:UDP-GlcNAc:undecaprenyl-phosphate/decaprenyl-phosphate GlcNAc-1-phosphate transferase